MTSFIERVEHYLDGLWVSTGPAPGCEACGLEGCESMEDEAYQLASEPSFSWSLCDSCGSGLGGDRHYAHGITHENEALHLSICTDCLLFHANGDLPDED